MCRLCNGIEIRFYCFFWFLGEKGDFGNLDWNDNLSYDNIGVLCDRFVVRK